MYPLHYKYLSNIDHYEQNFGNDFAEQNSVTTFTYVKMLVIDINK